MKDYTGEKIMFRLIYVQIFLVSVYAYLDVITY